MSFEREKLPFDREPARVANETAIGTDDSVAGDDDGDGIASIGHTDGSDGARVSYGGGNGFIRNGCAVGNVPEFLPDAEHEGSAHWRQRN